MDNLHWPSLPVAPAAVRTLFRDVPAMGVRIPPPKRQCPTRGKMLGARSPPTATLDRKRSKFGVVTLHDLWQQIHSRIPDFFASMVTAHLSPPPSHHCIKHTRLGPLHQLRLWVDTSLTRFAFGCGGHLSSLRV